jgi:hypothetical protein
VRLAPPVARCNLIDTSLQAALIPQSPHPIEAILHIQDRFAKLAGVEALVCDFRNFRVLANTVSSQENKAIWRDAQKVDSAIERRSLTLWSLSDRRARGLELPQRPAPSEKHENSVSAERQQNIAWSRPAGETSPVSSAREGVLRFYKREGAALPLFGTRCASANTSRRGGDRENGMKESRVGSRRPPGRELAAEAGWRAMGTPEAGLPAGQARPKHQIEGRKMNGRRAG